MPLAASLFFAAPAQSEQVGPPCCQRNGETHPPDPHSDPILLLAEVERLDERSLTAGAEVPIIREAPLVRAIGVPLEATRGVSEPEYVGVTVESAEPPAPDVMPPCCQVVSDTEPPHGHPKEPPLLIVAKVKHRQERTLAATAEAPVAPDVPLVHAIGIPLTPERVVSDPKRRAPVEARWQWVSGIQPQTSTAVAVFLLLLAIGCCLAIRRPRSRPRFEREPPPMTPPGLNEFPVPGIASAPVPEPELALARARRKNREREPA
jgi:hypothetical protein